jgi:hypothetical protein
VLALAALAAVWPVRDANAYESLLTAHGAVFAAGAAALAAAAVIMVNTVEIGMTTPTTRGKVLSVVVVPLAVVVWWGVSLHDLHGVHQRARDTFSAYTHRFPAGKLERPYVAARRGDAVILCAVENHASHARQYFCTNIDTGASQKHRITGGYTVFYTTDRNFKEHEYFRACFGVSVSLCPSSRGSAPRGGGGTFRPGFRPGGYGGNFKPGL